MNMWNISETDWSSAIERIRSYGGVFVRVGDRRHEEWKPDTLRVMHRVAVDPRGWEFADDPGWWWVPDYADDEFELALAERPKEVEEGLPFFGVTERSLDWLYETSRQGAALAIKSALGKRRDSDMPGEVQSVLRRFGGDARYFTNITELQGVTNERPSGWSFSPISSYMMDHGAIVVTASEVGVFWTFEED
jgi:hypothetical protein